MTRDLRALFDPRSVAIVGASANPAKWGYALSRSALKGAHRRSVFLVNRNGDQVLGQPSYRSLDELPESPELVAIVIRADGFEAAVDDALKAGAKAIVAITAGIGERDAAGRALQESVTKRVRAANAVLVGPNCLGIADTGAELNLTWDDFRPGPVGLISQSGNLGLELAQLAGHVDIGFSRFISIGNQADLDARDCLAALIDHEPTRVIAVYLEDFRDGRAFVETALAAARTGKPVILLTVGSTDASVRTAHSHTGGLVSDSVAVDAACRASGMYRVDTPQQMIELIQLLLVPSPAGRRAAIVGDGGGHVALAADRITARGLQVEPFSDRLTAALEDGLPSSASGRNPVDIAGAGEEDVGNFERVVRQIAQSGEADFVLVTGYFGGYSEQSDAYRQVEITVAEAMAAATEAAGVALIVHSMFPNSPSSRALRRSGVPVYADIEAVAIALGHIVNRMPPSPAADISLPFAGGFKNSLPLAGPAGPREPRFSAMRAFEAFVEGVRGDYFTTRHLLAEAGIPFAEAHPASSESETIAAATAIGYPVVLKALGTSHKSDARGVRLGIANGDALREAFRDMQSRLHPDLFSVERQAHIELGVELLIGVKRDRSFGPIALVGLGGLYTEVMRDVAVALAPISSEQGAQLIRSLRGSELLMGSRGRPRLDIEAAARALSVVSEVGALTDVAEIEVNPLLVLEQGVVGLDARIVPPTSAATDSIQ